MLDEKSLSNDFWCPTEDRSSSDKAKPGLELTAAEMATLSRFGRREWVADAQIDRLLALGLVEKGFGQAVLTRLGRTALGLAS